MRLRKNVTRQTRASFATIGLDLSLRGAAVAIVSGHPHRKIGEGLEAESALFRIGEDSVGPERLSLVTNALWQWIVSRGAGQEGDLYSMEGYGFASQRAHSLGELGGCVRRQIYESGGNLIVVPPSTLKKYVTGSGATDKSVVMKYVDKRWNFDVDDDNQCDAFSCSVLALVDSSDRYAWTNVETEILTKKVERYAGKGQTDWSSGSPTRRVAKRASRRRSRRVSDGSPVFGEDA